MNNMLKVLLKKQFLATINGFGKNKKSRNRSVTSYVVILSIVCVFMGVSFFQSFNQMSKTLLEKGLGWLFFAYVGLMAMGLSILGSVFMAVSQLYDAKDNDFLLSLPIPSRYILFVRMVPLYVQNVIFSSVILIPAFIAKCINGGANAVQSVLFLFMFFAVPLFALFVTCLLGLLISFLTSKMRDKTLVTVIFSFIFAFVYFFIYFSANNYLTTLIQKSEEIGNGIIKSFYPLYAFGKALEGEFVNFAITFSVIIALFGSLYFVLSKTYIKFITTKRGGVKTKSKTKALKSSSMFSTLFKKEVKRFFGSAMYFLNCGFGCLILIIVLIVFSVKSDFFILQLSQIMAVEYLPAILLVGIIFISSMNCVSAPSISLEGKNIWLLQSLPIDLFSVLKAKLTLHYIVTAPIATITSIVFAILLKPSALMIVSMVLMPSVVVILFGAIGLCFNLKKPNLDWDNETLVLKQSSSVMFTIFTGYGIFGLLIGIYAGIRKFLSIDIFSIITLCLLVVASVLVLAWLKKKGTKILANL